MVLDWLVPALLHQLSSDWQIDTHITPDEILQLTCCSAALQNGLRFLDLSHMQLSGSIPDCLFALPGTLSQADFANNNLTGTVPDVIPANSSLFGMVLAFNNLTGTIPGSLQNASMLSSLELNNNQLQGSMPEDFAAGMSMLDAVQLSSNTLTGQYIAGSEASGIL